MRDRRTKLPGAGLLDVDVNPLVIVGRVGEQIDAVLRDLLGFINLVDVLENPRDYRIRLMGTKTKPIVGSDITGKRYSEIDPKRKFYFIGEAYTLCIGQATPVLVEADLGRSEEHTSELQSLMRISYAVFCLKK